METLARMKAGETAFVKELAAWGAIRGRLQGLGIVPGTKVECLQKSPLGDPVAYAVRGAVIALRLKDAETVLVSDSISEVADGF